MTQELTREVTTEIATETTTFGNYRPKPESQEYLRLCFSASSLPLQKLWRNNGLSADFLADYFVTFFPAVDDKTQEYRQTEVRAAISYIANELLENAMKYSQAGNDATYDVMEEDCSNARSVSFAVHLRKERILFYVSNVMDSDKVAAFQGLIEELLDCDVEERYFQQLEQNALGEGDGQQAFMGFLTMMHDYQAELAWRFASAGEGLTRVTNMIELDIT